MKYDEFLKMLKEDRFQGIAGLFVLPLIQFIFLLFGFNMGDVVAKVAAACLALYLARFEVLILIQIFGQKRKVQQMKDSIGAESEEAFAELIEQAKVFDRQFFVTEKYVLNFQTFRAYERDLIYNVECYECARKETDALDHIVYYRDYGIKITYNVHMEGRYIFMNKQKKEQRDALYQVLKSNAGIL